MIADRLPDAIAPVIAATVYVPLWPLSVAGLPVFGSAESWGWPAPSVLGWGLLLVFWSTVWWLGVTALARVRIRGTQKHG